MSASQSVQEGHEHRDWRRLGDAGVLFCYTGVVLWTIRYHEKWADEAQAWLIARDLDLRYTGFTRGMERSASLRY